MPISSPAWKPAGDLVEALLPKEAQSTGTSFAETVLSLSKICIGSGVLALPWGLLQGGMVALPGILFIAFWNWYTSWQLLACKRALLLREAPAPALTFADVPSKEKRSSYSSIVRAVLGRKGMLAFEGSLIAVLFGVCCSLQIQSANLLTSVVPYLSYVNCVLGAAVPLAPLVLQRSLRNISWISAMALLVLLVGLCTVAATGIAMNGLPPWPAQFSVAPSAQDLSCFLGIALFAFGMQALVLPVCDGMRERDRAPAALLVACCLVTSLYIVMGFGIALLFADSPDGVQQLIILNLPEDSFVKALVCGCSALMALLSYPLMAMGIVQLVRGANILRGADGTDSAAREYAFRTLLLSCSTATAAAIPKFGLIAGVVGCLTLVNGQLLPPLLHMRLCCKGRGQSEWLHLAINSLLILLGVAAFIFAAYELATAVTQSL